MAGMGLQGAYAVEEIQKHIRQRMLDQMAQQEMARKAQVDQQEIGLRSRSLDQNDQLRRDQLDEQRRMHTDTIANNEREFALSANEAIPPETALEPSNPIVGSLRKIGVPLRHEDPTMASTQTAGYSSLPTPGKSIMGRMITNEAAAQPERYIKPASQKQAEAEEGRTFRASEAEAARAFRATESKAGRDAADARAKDSLDTRRDIAAIGAQGAGATRDLSNQLKEVQIRAEKEKLDTAVTSRTQQKDAFIEATKTALDSVDALLTHPGMGASTGAFEVRNLGGGLTQDVVGFNAKRNNLIAALTLPNLGALKGAMSDKDLIFVKELATTLSNKRLSQEDTIAELERAKLFLKHKLGQYGGAEAAPTALPAGVKVKRIG